MKNLVWIVVLWTSIAFAQFEILPSEQSKAVKPGEVAEVLIKLSDESLVNAITPQSLQAQGDAASFFLYSLSPWFKNKDVWEIKGKIVFGKSFTPDQIYNFSINNESVQFQFKGWIWSPNPEDIPKEFSYEEIQIFTRSWWIKNWPITAIVLLLLIISLVKVTTIFLHSRKTALEVKKRKNQLKDEIINAQTIQDFALLWLKRDEVKHTFPTHEASIRKFFDELNRFQFKPRVEESELTQLSLAKSKLLSELSEEKHGV